MKKLKYTTLLIGLLTAALFTLPLERVHAEVYDLTASFGNLCEYVGKIQTDESGKKNTCSFLPYIASSFDYPLTEELSLSPQVGTSFPQSGRDENIKRMSLFALANVKYKINSFTLLGGLGFYVTRIWGPGGGSVLNNGTGTDSFPLPEEAVYSRNFVLNLGAGMNFTPEISGEIYTYIFNTLEKEDRAFSIGLSATYHFGEIL